MKRIFYLSLLLVLPFLLHANHGRSQLNGRWISPYFDTQIKIRVKRQHIRVKGLTRRGWTNFQSIRRNVFEDCSGNRIRFKNVHELVYINRFRGERIRFVKKGHRHLNHTCNVSCSLGNDNFGYTGPYDSYSENYGGNYADDYGYDDYSGFGGGRSNRDREINSSRIDGRYLVREIDEYVTLKRTRNGLRARKGSEKWVAYTQNRYRKNEYTDKKGNKYLVRSDGSITWKSKNGKVSLNLQK
ncbi:MAG: hypothetical protein AAGA77_04960 [Bacteroidota bacterium]